jgi:hypothetical protein
VDGIVADVIDLAPRPFASVDDVVEGFIQLYVPMPAHQAIDVVRRRSFDAFHHFGESEVVAFVVMQQGEDQMNMVTHDEGDIHCDLPTVIVQRMS